MTAEERSEAARRSHTPESDQKRSKSMRLVWDDEEFRDRRATTESQPETKAKRSAASSESNNRPGRREHQSKIMQQKFAEDEDFRERHSAGIRQSNIDDPSRNEARSESMKRAWVEQPEAFINSRTWMSGEPTTIEMAIADELTRRGILFEGPRTEIEGCWYELDILVPHLKLNIEADGTYWHNEKFFPWRKAHDDRRDAFLTGKLGYRVLRLSEDEIRKSDWSRLDQELERLN